MKFSLSTNWCNRRLESGEEIAEKALELGFTELELGFHTTQFQAEGFKRMLDQIPVGSIHAFCPVPLSAPQGYPELYSLASADEDERALARIYVTKNVRFAAEMGADTVVLHAGRVPFGGLFNRMTTSTLTDALRAAEKNTDDKAYAKLLAKARKSRTKRGLKMLDVFRAELEKLVPELEKSAVTLALENMPYYEGFPLRAEMETIIGWKLSSRIGAWYDTGHARVCACHGWTDAIDVTHLATLTSSIVGLHLNDVKDLNDDHLAPGCGNVDFGVLKTLAASVRHIVFEPNAEVSEDDLRSGVNVIRHAFAASAANTLNLNRAD